MKKTFLGILPLFLLPFSLIGCTSNNTSTVYITSVHDGDTFYDVHNNKYRLFGVDTPEMSSPPKTGGDWVDTEGIERKYALEATVFTRKLINHKNVKMIYIKNDIHGRKVVKVHIGNKDLATELLREGLARIAYFEENPSSPFFSDDYNYMEKLLEEQYKAYTAPIKKGFWKQFPSKFKEIFPKA